MNEKTLNYIRSHNDLYQLLRDESHYYEDIYKDNSVVYSLERLAKEKYGHRFVDRIDRLSSHISILSSFLDAFQ